MMNLNRYNRQIILPELGAEGQLKLSKASVLIIGAGGLGCPALLYLAAAGVGRIGIVDFDKVDTSNLHRQILYAESDEGKLKVKVAAEKIRQQNSTIIIEEYCVRLSTENAIELISAFDVVVDGTDNFATRYLVNDACILLNKPLVYGAIYRFEGQVTVLNVPNALGIKITYRDIFPTPPSAEDAPDCAVAGVIGVLPGLIGTYQANEVIKVITGMGTSLAGSLLLLNVLSNSFYTVQLEQDSGAHAEEPRSVEAFKKMNYEWFCNPVKSSVREVEWIEAETMLLNESALLVDVREHHELPKLIFKNSVKMPLSELELRCDELKDKEMIIFICQSGQRSKRAADLVNNRWHSDRAMSLIGGMARWKELMNQSKV